MSQKFVILSMSRSGSGYVYTMLDSHPQILAHGELFKAKDIGALSGKLGVERQFNRAWLNYEYREERPIRFLKKTLSYETGIKHVGFKIFFSQKKIILNHVIKSNEFKKIVLLRDNVLAMYSSAETAKKSGQGKVHIGQKPKNVKVEFIRKNFENFNKRRQVHIEKGYQLLKKHKASFLEIRYAELLDKKKFNKILDYLNVERQKLKPGVARRNPKSIIDRFTNPDEVIEYVKKIGKPDWLKEEIYG